jgi:signal transduction histidine kinase
LLARTISRPVRELTAATQLVAQGELGHQVPVRGQDELGGLATSFNQMSSDLAQASASRRQMTADIAHELRTPLSVILGYAEGLREGKLQADEETFSVIHQETQHLNHLVDDLRTLALADAGELTLTCRPVAPRDLLARTATAYAPQAQRQDVALQMNVEEGLPSVEVDPDRFAQVLGNLVSNALRYTPAGGEITLMAGLGSQSVVLRVKDNGAGIDPGVLPYIFERFYKGDKSRHEDGESGLGLAIVKSIVEAHGGEILVESEPGQGAVFTIKIPRIQIQTRA